MPSTIDTNLASMGKWNRPLADELAKLPEISQFESASTRLALENLVTIYRYAPGRFDGMFDRMHRIGLPAHRKYCAPLQAVFWMIQDANLEGTGTLLGLEIEKRTDGRGRSRPHLASSPSPLPGGGATMEFAHAGKLKQTLNAAWHDETELIPSVTIRQIIRRLKTRTESEEYALLVERHSDRQLQNYILDDYQRKKAVFSTKDWAVIEKALQRSRWKAFFTVADRLNAPELVNHYINENFFFRKTPASGVYFTFFEKRAQCTDAAYFTQFMLDRAGYRTFMRSVKWDEDPWDGLHTGAGIIRDDGSYLLVANYTGINAISGPFATVAGLDRQLSCNRKIVDSRWGAYYPPRHY